MDAYHPQGENATKLTMKQVQYAMKKYNSHRCIPAGVMDDLEHYSIQWNKQLAHALFWLTHLFYQFSIWNIVVSATILPHLFFCIFPLGTPSYNRTGSFTSKLGC
jgi:hypothetical protein